MFRFINPTYPLLIICNPAPQGVKQQKVPLLHQALHKLLIKPPIHTAYPGDQAVLLFAEMPFSCHISNKSFRGRRSVYLSLRQMRTIPEGRHE